MKGFTRQTYIFFSLSLFDQDFPQILDLSCNFGQNHNIRIINCLQH